MNMTIANYLVYLVVTIPLTVWVGRALYRHGATFLVDVFRGDEKVATAVNQLLVIGFYLLNLGYVAVFMKGDAVTDGTDLIENVVRKIGAVAIVLGVVHLFNLWVFNALREKALRRAGTTAVFAPPTYR